MFSYIMNKIKRAAEGDRLSESSINNAVGVIEKHGMKAHFYFAGVGNRCNEELSDALDTLEAAEFIITSPNGALVGKVATRNFSSGTVGRAAKS